jgi:aerobic C4-dicarboxylate transport protein
MSSSFVFVNIVGNSVATIVVANWEKALDRVALHRELKTGFRPVDPPPAGRLSQTQTSGGQAGG